MADHAAAKHMASETVTPGPRASRTTPASGVAAIRSLQQRAGNRAVRRLLETRSAPANGVQRAISITSPKKEFYSFDEVKKFGPFANQLKNLSESTLKVIQEWADSDTSYPATTITELIKAAAIKAG